jgi:hypothetical protein
VLRLEYRRDEPIGIDDEIDDDELLREVHYFRTLDEVQEYVGDFGHALENIKWRHASTRRNQFLKGSRS